MGVRTLKRGDLSALMMVSNSSLNVVLIQCLRGHECVDMADLDCANVRTCSDAIVSRACRRNFWNCLLVRLRWAVLDPIAAVIEIYTWESKNFTQGVVLAIKTIMAVIFSISFTVKDLR